MSTALEAASLVMVPSGYEDGTLASVKPTDGTGDFTFSRGSDISATRVNADGYIEKGYENLLLQSNSFTTSPWNIVGSHYNLTSGQVGYDGSNDAWLLEKTTTSNYYFGQSVVSVGSVYTVSLRAKADSANSGILLFFGTPFLKVDLEAKNVYSRRNSIFDSVTDIGNGWVEIVFTFVASSTSTNFQLTSNNSTGQTGSIYIQDAMINQGLVAYPYKETTTAPVAGGILEDMPRLDYSSCPALLLEPSRTNILVNSEYFADRVYNSTIATQNYGLSPEGAVNSALIDKNGVPYGRVDYNFNYPSGTYTYSAFVKGNDVVKLRLDYSGASKEAYINCSNGQTTNHPFYPMDSISSVDYGNGWYRFICTTAIPSGLILSFARLYPMDVVGGEGNTNPATAEIYGLQLEQDATYPTSYIPTYGVSQTRLAESMVSDTSSFGITDEFTFFIDTNGALVSGTSLNTLDDLRWYTQSTNKYRFYKNSDAIFLGNSIQVNDRTKIALKITATQCKTFVDGVLHSTISLTTPFASFDTIFRGTETKVKDELNQITLFPTALTDSECIELTTI